MTRVSELLVASLVPGRCLHCRGPARAGEPLCLSCRAVLPWLPTSGCPRCGLPVRCRTGRCPAATAAFAAAWAPLGYEGPACSLARALKAPATARVARWLAAAMVARGPDGWRDGVAAVVPVPADPERRRRRGSDHAATLAAAVAARLDLPRITALAREPSRGRPAQRSLSRVERRRLAPPKVVAAVPATVLLVDDVHTTGATLDAAARALHDRGVRRVLALTAFRAGR